jgi:hypothetical protein
LRGDPRELAEEILRLCGQAANRAGLARRAELAAAGIGSDALDRLGLPKPEEVAHAAADHESEYAYEQQSWLEFE